MTTAQQVFNIVDSLEVMVDASTLATVTDALAEVCYLKADHIRQNWQDNITSKPWDVAAGKLVTLTTKLDI